MQADGERERLVRWVGERLDSDPAWQEYAGSGAWICAYCFAPVDLRGSAGEERAGTVERHLSVFCGAFQRARSRARTVPGVSVAEVATRVARDPAWRVFDHEGFWYSPSTLRRVDSVRLRDGVLDGSVHAAIAASLATCETFRRGQVHPAAEVLAARDSDARRGRLGRCLEANLDMESWRRRSPGGIWFCALCVYPVETADALGQEGVEAMVAHLLDVCPAVQGDQPESRLQSALALLPAPAPADEPAAWVESGWEAHDAMEDSDTDLLAVGG